MSMFWWRKKPKPVSSGPVFRDHPLAYPDMAAFVAVIEHLPEQDQARMVRLLLRIDYSLIADPAMQQWINSHAGSIWRMAKKGYEK